MSSDCGLSWVIPPSLVRKKYKPIKKKLKSISNKKKNAITFIDATLKLKPRHFEYPTYLLCRFHLHDVLLAELDAGAANDAAAQSC